MRAELVALCCLATGCVGPRSLTLGQPASLLGAGAEVAVSGGYAFSPSLNSQQPMLHEAPRAEANVRGALGDSVELQLRVGAQGLQPAVKVGLSMGVVDLALLPTFGVGYYSLGETIPPPNGLGAQSGQYQLTLSAGVSALLSMRGGAYFGLGYQFVSSDLGIASPSMFKTNNPQGGHQVALMIGWDIQLGRLSIRPEAGAFCFFPTAVAPVAETSPRVGSMTTVTFALDTRPR